jgi:hypothetical protein
MMNDRSSRMKHDEVSNAEVQPWHRLGGVEHICELRKSSQVLYSIFVSILRMIYSGKNGRVFGCPDVLWRSDPKKTELWIDTELRWEDLRPDFTPAIFVCLGEIQYGVNPTLDMEGRTFMSNDGERSYERTARGSAAIVHVSDKAGAACALADNTENYLSMLQDQLCDEYCFDHLLVSSRVPRQQKEQAQTAGKGKYVSVVNVQFDFTDSWVVKIESPILKSVSMVESGHSSINVTGSIVDVRNGMVEIDFGDVSSETRTPLDI